MTRYYLSTAVSFFIVPNSPATGEILQEFRLGPQVPGSQVPFQWEGKDENGQRLKINGEHIPDGEYKVNVQTLSGKDWTQAKTIISTAVDSVSIADSGEILLNASTVGTVSLNDLKKIAE